MNTKFETYSTVVINVAHVTEHDGELLLSTDTNVRNLISYRDNIGLTQGINLPAGSQDMIEHANALVEAGFSEHLRYILYAMHSNGYARVEIDSDGPIYECFQKFDW